VASLRSALRDPHRDAAIHSRRLAITLLMVVTALTVVGYRYYGLQIVDHQRYLTQSDRNRVRLEAIPPKRGLIFDRRGRLLASNIPSHRLSIVLERVDDLDELLAHLERLVGLDAHDLERFNERRVLRRPYDPVPLKLQLSDTEMARVGVNLHDLPGVAIEAQLTRHYPHGELFSHVVGYVGRINEQETARLDDSRYRGTLHVGKIGIEKRYESVLHGGVGAQNVEANAHGRVLRVVDKVPPTDGADLQLHIDLDLQRVAFEALGQQRGAIVAIDPRNGGILALVSNPGFDSNLFVNGISSKDYEALRTSVNSPLFNRAVQGQYPPGSTIKPMLGLAGLTLNLIEADSTVADPGWYQLAGDSRRYRDWILRIRGTGHAPEVDLRMAIAESCDVYYYDLAHRMGIERVAESLAPYGFGVLTTLDTTGEKAGILPNTDWKRQRLGEPWYPGETLSVGIGQGYMLATPLQLAQATMVLANRGTSFVPSLVKRVGESPNGAEVRPPLIAAEEHWRSIIEGMMDVVHDPRGTAAAIGTDLSYTMAGKTGTSQVIGIAQDDVYEETDIAEHHRNHGWFIAFAPVDKPRIAIVVLAENGGGSSAAYPVARKVMDAWLLDDANAGGAVDG